MASQPRNLPFRGYLAALQQAQVLNLRGEITKSGRGCWGGRTLGGQYCLTVWADACVNEHGQYYCWKPSRNNGGLLAAWGSNELREGTEVRVIMLRQKGSEKIGGGSRQIGGGLLMQGKWRIVKYCPHGYGKDISQSGVIVEPVSAEGLVPAPLPS